MLEIRGVQTSPSTLWIVSNRIINRWLHLASFCDSDKIHHSEYNRHCFRHNFPVFRLFLEPFPWNQTDQNLLPPLLRLLHHENAPLLKKEKYIWHFNVFSYEIAIFERILVHHKVLQCPWLQGILGHSKELLPEACNGTVSPGCQKVSNVGGAKIISICSYDFRVFIEIYKKSGNFDLLFWKFSGAWLGLVWLMWALDSEIH